MDDLGQFVGRCLTNLLGNLGPAYLRVMLDHILDLYDVRQIYVCIYVMGQQLVEHFPFVESCWRSSQIECGSYRNRLALFNACGLEPLRESGIAASYGTGEMHSHT